MTFFFILLLFMPLLLPSSSYATNPNLPVAVAVAEMQKANYFAYAMLVNMALPDLIQANLTFLMPNDKSLSTANVAETSVSDFLLRHSIPWPLLFEHMEHFPTGSLIPTSRPGLVLKVSNDGRRRFFFNNARIISPNICTKSASIRCHGIDVVVQPSLIPESSCPPRAPAAPSPPPSPPMSNVTHRPTLLQPPPPPPPAPASIPHPPAPSVEVDDDNNGPAKSGGDHRCDRHPGIGGVASLLAVLCFML